MSKRGSRKRIAVPALRSIAQIHGEQGRWKGAAQDIADLRECPRVVAIDASPAPGFSASPSSPNRLRVREWKPAPRRRAGDSDA